MGHLRDIGSGKPYYYNINLGVRKNIKKIGTAPIIIDRLIHCCELLAYHAYQELWQWVFLIILLKGEVIRNVFLKTQTV